MHKDNTTMDLLQRTKELLRLYRVTLRRHLGQNLAVESTFLRKLVSNSSLSADDVVLEVGAGLGFLTRLLSEKCKNVLAVEVDPIFIRILKDQLWDRSNVDLIEGDIFKVHLETFNKVVSAPPYQLSSPLIFFLLERGFDCAVLSLQEEFAERLVAPVGSKEYSRLTVMVNYNATTEILDNVSRDVFYPPPKVDSAIVRLKPRKPPFPIEDKKIFFNLVKIMFSQRNRKVRNGVTLFLREQNIEEHDARKMADSIFLKDKRVRELTLEDFGAIADELLRKEPHLR